MTTIKQAKGKTNRRFNCNLHGKAKTSFLVRNFPPGQHGGRGYRKLSAWGKQLIACRKFQVYYQILEKQSRRYYLQALKMRGDSGENYVGLLERRLDAVVYRLNFAPTIYAAGQLVSHKHILVNGRKVNIRSYLVKAGDVIELTENARSIPMVIESLTRVERPAPSYLDLEVANFKGKFIKIPVLAEIPYAAIMEPNLVVERYSK